MDDTTSRQQIDELADLYLTEPGQAADAATPSPVEGPAPIKLSPKLEGQATPPVEPIIEPPAPSIEDDSHPVLRLTEAEVEQQTSIELEVKSKPIENDEPTDKVVQDEPAARAVLEAVLMGNLPGMSGPWLTQYAQLLAQTEGPVILLHVGEGAIDLELVEPRAEAQPTPPQETTTVRIPPMRGDRTGLVGLIDALVRSEQTPARTILVRFDSIGDAQALSRLAAMEDWTLLCGSDNASIAAASQQIRNAVQSEPRLADRNVGIMVMGSDDLAAEQAARRIASELEHDLAAPAELVGHLKRMQPVQVRDLGSFPDPVSLWPKLVGFFDSLEVPEPIAMPEPEPKPQEKPEPVAIKPPPAAPKPKASAASRPAPTPRFRQAPSKPSATASGLRTPDKSTSRVSQQATPSASGARRSPAINTQNKESSPSIATPMRPTPTPRVLTREPELDLVALIGQGPAALDNPVALDARLPDQPETQLVVDAQGTVHLLAQHLADHAEARAAMMQLIEAGRWVQNHLELIALTQRDHDFVDAEPMLHLLTDRADLTTQIVGKLSGQIRLHLLQQVQLGRESGWFCTPLA